MSGTRGTRTRLADGIYQDAYGISACVTIGSGQDKKQREKRYPGGTSLKTIKAWQTDTRSALQKLTPTVERGTFAADVDRYLQARRSMPTYQERETHLALWSAEFGQRARYTITTVEIDIVLQRWFAAGLAAGTVQKRRTALMGLWTVLDGRGAPNPVRAAFKPAAPDPEDRSLPYARIVRILDAMPNTGRANKGEKRGAVSLTKLRLAVLAYTGLPHSLIKQLTPADLDLAGARVRAGKRRKGAGVERRWLPLTAEGVAALTAFAEAGAWGDFSNSSVNSSWHRACDAAGVPRCRPYDLRHSFAAQVYRQSGDAQATGALLMHSAKSRSELITKRYTLGGVDARLRLAASAFSAGLDGTGPELPAASPEMAGSRGWQPVPSTSKSAKTG
jgi:integrase